MASHKTTKSWDGGADSDPGLVGGTTVGKCRLSRKLGAGSHGDVWRARDTVEGLMVARKIPRLREDVDESAILLEVRLVASWRHPSILPCALGCAHRVRVVHCDVSPSNIFMFPDGRTALGDFGTSRYYKPRMPTMDEFGTRG
jgi:hypothetical protein